MEKIKSNHLNLYVCAFLIIIANLKYCSTRSVFFIENKDFYGIFNDLQKDIAECKARVANNISYKIHSYSINNQPTVQATIATERTSSLWPLETITRKHFEIINMLWRKSKILKDGNDFTIIHTQTPSGIYNNVTTKLFRISQNNNPINIFSKRTPTITTTTPSKIEFYYLNDENNLDDKEEKCSFGSKCISEKTNFQNMGTPKPSNSSFLVFHVRGPSLDVSRKAKSVPMKRHHNDVSLNKNARNSYSTNTSPTIFKQNGGRKKKPLIIPRVPNVTYSTKGNIRINFSQTYSDPLHKTKSVSTKKYPKSVKTPHTKATVYDKIKFFEMYDRMTPVTASKWQPPESEYDAVDIPNKSQNKMQNEERVFLINVDQSGHEHNQSKHSKKHIRADQLSNTFSTQLPKVEQRLVKNKLIQLKNEIKANISVQSTSEEINKFRVISNYFNKTVEWSDYPFAAVYIYEPSKTHCDAAAISPHWLIAAGACLSRLNKNPNGVGRSAFVAYCGAEWWKPERISYVKYSLVHPSFHPAENPRKYLYNIGLIQVVTSMMSACNGWSPVTLMSHQFATAHEGTVASALGWGLDRFDLRHTSMNLPRSPLALYNALLFSDSCPGNLASSEGISSERRPANKNVYCLTLPPYFGEDTDPVHGGLLLVGSNLIALYLKIYQFPGNLASLSVQEERRSWGEQSAQYTGIWRLIPWITEVAKETEDIETTFVEI